jgi:hypothetical protein
MNHEHRIPFTEIADAPAAHDSEASRQADPHPQLQRLLPQPAHGFAGALFLLFFGTAWLNWDGRQAVLWDLADSKFHIFGATFWPQDFILLSALLIICAFGLFAITVFAGRVWCGYSCPQSTWTWLFMWCEKVTEGDRNQRIKLAAAPWSLNKLARAPEAQPVAGHRPAHRADLRRLLHPDPPAGRRAVHLQLGGVALFWVLFFTARPTSTPAGCARRCACTCAHMRASRV